MRKIIILIRNVLDFILPETQLGDKIYSYINFIFNHKGRFPKNQVLFNDYMFNLKTSSEIINPSSVDFSILILLIAFFDKASLNNKIQTPCFLPRPTRPRS